MKKGKTNKSAKQTLAVKFASCGGSGETCRIRFSTPRGGRMSDAEAIEMFVNAQLDVELSVDPNADGDAEGQQTMGDMALSLEAVAECRRIGIDYEKISSSLSMKTSAVDTSKLFAFAGHAGTLAFQRIGDASGSEDGEADEA